jgi:hypothetical protein
MGEDQNMGSGLDKAPESEPSGQNKKFASRVVKRMAEVIRHNKRRAVATGAAITAAGVAGVGVNQALENKQNSMPSTGPNVPTQTAATEAKPPLPKVIATQQQTLEKIEFVIDGKLSPNELPRDPIEVGKQLIKAAQEADSPNRSEYGVPLLVGNRAAVAIQAKKDFTIYQWPKGSKNFTPADSSNDGSAGARTIRTGQAVYINNFVELVTYTDPSRTEGARDEPIYILATLPGSDEVFFISPTLLEKDGDATVSILTPGGGHITKGDASIGDNNSFRMGDLSNVSKMQIVEDQNAIKALANQDGLEPQKQSQDHPPPPPPLP